MENLEQIKKIHHEICDTQDRLNKLLNDAVNLGVSVDIDTHEFTDSSVGYSHYEYKSVNVRLSIRMLRP